MGSTLNLVSSLIGLGIFGYFFMTVIYPRMMQGYPRMAPPPQQPSTIIVPSAPQQQQQQAPAPTPKGKTTTTTPSPQQQQQQAPSVSTAGGGFTFNVVGDSREDDSAAGQCVCGDNPTLVLLTGDFMQGGPASQWQKTYSACSGKLSKIFASRGNHDGSGSDYLKIFALNKGKWSSMHKQGPIAFIACDTISDNPSNEEPLFQQAQNDPAIKNIVVIMHEPIFTIGASSDSERGYHTMFTKYPKTRLVIAGHNHYYYRVKPINNILYITNGTGGAADSGGSVSPGTEIHAYGCLKCSVSAGGAINCKWVGNDGKIGDTFGITETGKLTATGGVTPKDASTSGFAESFYSKSIRQILLDPAMNEDDFPSFLRYISKPRRKFNRYLYDYNTVRSNNNRYVTRT